MIQLKQLRPLFATSSSSWMLLLLSLYFSWICPAEPVAHSCVYGTVLVGQNPIKSQGSFYLYNLKAPKSSKNKVYLSAFSFQKRIAFCQDQAETIWLKGRQRQNLLPTPSTFYQVQTHLPRSIAAC